MSLSPVYIGDHRCHHGLVGAALAVVGAIIALTDWRDRRRWIPDLRLRR